MAELVKWQAQCIVCGKGGMTLNLPPHVGAPSCPPSMGGICPNCKDKTHKPKWKKVSY